MNSEIYVRVAWGLPWAPAIIVLPPLSMGLLLLKLLQAWDFFMYGTTLGWDYFRYGTTLGWDYILLGLLQVGTTLGMGLLQVWDYFRYGTTLGWDYFRLGLLQVGTTLGMGLLQVGTTFCWDYFRLGLSGGVVGDSFGPFCVAGGVAAPPNLRYNCKSIKISIN